VTIAEPGSEKTVSMTETLLADIKSGVLPLVHVERKAEFEQALKNCETDLSTRLGELKLVVTSWTAIKNMKGDISGATRLFDIYNEAFTGECPRGAAILFPYLLPYQIKSFISMVHYMVMFIQDFPNFSKKILEISALHFLLNVDHDTYLLNAKVASDAVAKLFNDMASNSFEEKPKSREISEKIHKVWHDALMQISSIMLLGQQFAEVNYYTFNAHRSFISMNDATVSSSWKKSSLIIFIDKIYYFDDTKCRHVAQFFPMNNTEIEDVEDHLREEKGMPTKFCYRLIHTDGFCWINDIQVVLCFDSQKEATDSRALLELRTNAGGTSKKKKGFSRKTSLSSFSQKTTLSL